MDDRPVLLVALDHARTQLFHLKAIVVAGMGLFTDAYDLFCIVPVMKMIGRIYYQKQDDKSPGVTPQAVVSAAVAITLAGTVIGQLVFGALGDRIGRRRVYGLCLTLMVLSSFGCGFSVCRTRNCVIGSLCFFRFLLGIGIGGDYPLSATIISEFANQRIRGALIASVFSMQGFGILASSWVTMAVTAAFDRAWKHRESKPAGSLDTPESADVAWRLILMIGAVPAALTFYWRMMMPETARYTALVQNNLEKATMEMKEVYPELNTDPAAGGGEQLIPRPPPPRYGFFSMEFLRRHGRNLLACAGAWFIVDIPFYSNTLFQSLIYKVDPESNNVFQEAYKIARLQTVITVAAIIPGYFFSVLFIDRVGRRKIQMTGFLLMAVFLFGMAIPYDLYWFHHHNGYFLVLYGLIFFFFNFGPNTTTFIVPAELFPARFRTTCQGIAGAAGKVGAIIGSVGFLWASQDRKKSEKTREKGWKPGIGMMRTLIVLGLICIAGMIYTYYFTPETNGRSLEENEDEAGQEREEMTGNRLVQIGEL